MTGEPSRVGQAMRRLVASLAKAKVRRDERLFMAEGTKCVSDTLPHFICRYLIATPAWIQGNRALIPAGTALYEATRADMERMSQLSTPSDVIAVYDIPADSWNPADMASGLTLALDRVQDPGNLGTILRLCDWFGVRRIVCSADTADVYQPKVVQATMGAIARVKAIYTESLPDFLDRECAARGIPVCGTFLEGGCIYATCLPDCAVIVMGNEGRGISPDVARLCSVKLNIPSYPPGEPTSESLNVATATAVTLAEWRRRQI